MSFAPANPLAPIAALRSQYLRGGSEPPQVLDTAMLHSNSNANRNVYLAQKADWSRAEASALQRDKIEAQPLWGIPVSLKDCFDLADFPTSCGSSFYLDQHGIATKHSAVAAKLREAGAVITGKTHLHQLAYGITGENRDFGDCVQPRNAAWLTGGSSSGAAASVQEGSALAAIGTDTGGSIRTPAALCGLAGYRSSITLNTPNDALWRGGAHLAATFDTLGWLYRDLADGPLLARALFDLPEAVAPAIASIKIGVPDAAFFHDCDADVLHTFHLWQTALAQQHASLHAFDATLWNDNLAIFTPIQASEAAALHRGNFQHFEPAIAERLAWGASFSANDLTALRQQLAEIRAQTAALFQRFDYLLIPCAPMSALLAGADHTATRARILRYTAPASLCGLPTVVLPGERGGLQLIGPLGSDAELLALSASLTSIAATIQNPATLPL
jgi:aspartyl-tRNA(Asn)/glutamyl-tRNA(Gln) amidotransferase subunit A